MLKHGILGLLSYGCMTGYEITEIFHNSLNYFWSANTSQIYRELRTLKEKGFATMTTVPQNGKPDKNIFSITDTGREELKRWLRNPYYGNQNTPLCMKTFFAAELPKNENIERFCMLIADCDAFLHKYEYLHTVIPSFQARATNQNTAKYWEMTLDYGVRYMRMLKEWSENNLKILEGMK